MLRICYKSSFYRKTGFQNERKSKRFPTFLTFQANYSSLSAKHPYLPRSKNVPTFLEKPRDVFPKTSGLLEKASLGFLKDTATKSPKGAPQGREKTLFDGYFVFFLRLCRFFIVPLHII